MLRTRSVPLLLLLGTLSLPGCDFFKFTTNKPASDGKAPASNLPICGKRSHERGIDNPDQRLATELLCGDSSFGYHVQVGMSIEARHSTFDDRTFNHLDAGIMLLTCSKLCGESDPMAIGMLEWFGRKVDPKKMGEFMTGWTMDDKTKAAFVDGVGAGAQDMRKRASELDPRRQHMYVDVPNKVRDMRASYFKANAALYGKIDALAPEITKAKGGQADAAAVAQQLVSIREEYLSTCKSPDCRFDPLVIEVTRELILLHVAGKNDLAALAEWDLFRDKAPYRHAYAASVNMALYLAMKEETENNSAYQKMKSAGADEATLKARFGDPPPIKVTPSGAFKGSQSPPNLVAGIDRGAYDGVYGVVKNVSRPKDGVSKITFEDKVSSYQLTDCVDTRKIEAIEPGTGRIIYRQRCKAAGKKTTRKKTEPVLVAAADAVGLKSKEEVSVMVTKDTRTGFVLRAKNKDGDLVQLRSHRLDPTVERDTLFQVAPQPE